MSTIEGADSAAAETVSEAERSSKSWRDHLPVHPAANLFPRMSESELRELGEDIRANGLQQPIVVFYEDLKRGDAFKLLDGRNRLDAMELVGIDFKIRRHRNRRDHFLNLEFSHNEFGRLLIDSGRSIQILVGLDEADIQAFVASANLHRRHLTGEQKRDLIAKVLKATPEASNRQIAKQTKADDKTVASVRRDLESTAEIPQLEKTVGTDGKERKSRAKKKPKPGSPLDKLFEGAAPGRVTESAEVSIEDGRADMARLDEPAESAVDDVDRRVSCVFNTILRHVKGLSRCETERFLAALRDQIDNIERDLRDVMALAEATS